MRWWSSRSGGHGGYCGRSCRCRQVRATGGVDQDSRAGQVLELRVQGPVVVRQCLQGGLAARIGVDAEAMVDELDALHGEV